MSEILTGTYSKTIYRDEYYANTIFKFIPKDRVEYRDSFGHITCIGTIPVYTKGMPLKITGTWIENIKYGKQFYVEKIVESSDKEFVTIEYLEKVCNGIGPATAKKIVEKTGADIFNFVKREDAKEILCEISSIDSTIANGLIKTIKNTVDQREVFEYLSDTTDTGDAFPAAIEICKMFPKNPLAALKNNPYLVGSKAGLPFEVCDKIAETLGIPNIANMRIRALIYYAMCQCENSGNTYATLKEIYEQSKFILKDSADPEVIPASLLLYNLVQDKRFIIEKDTPNRIYFRSTWEAEQTIIQEINRLNNSKIELDYHESLIEYAERKCGIKFGDSQKETFNALRESGIKIITGGPGTGKTTTINGLVCAYKEMHPKKTIACCAPTGRAAQRMSESTGMEASTIHRLIEYQPFDNEATHKDASDPLDADIIIIDEFSMVDTKLFAMFLTAIKNGALILIVGDPEQLPSVGPGNLLHDLINSGKIESYSLDTVYRQKDESSILVNAENIKNGITELKTGLDFEIHNFETMEEVKEKIKEITREHYDHDDPYSMQVLTSTTTGPIGVVSLNNIIQEIVNTKENGLKRKDYSYKKGDKVMMLRNNYDKGYFNGDIGTITNIDEIGINAHINGEDFRIERTLLQDISLSYAMTIHKSQGSEFSTVVVVLPNRPRILLKRNLLYTAVTRAKKNVILITVEDSLETAINNTSIDKRKTRIEPLLRNNKPTLINRITDQRKYITLSM